MKKADMEIEYHFWVRCPLCLTMLDFADADNESAFDFSSSIFNGSWDEVKGKIVSCSFCDQDFKIGEIEI